MGWINLDLFLCTFFVESVAVQTPWDCKSLSAGDRAALNMHPCTSWASILHSIACNCFAISPTYGQTGGFLVRSLEPVFRQRCSRRATVAGSGKSRATRLTTVSGELPTYGKCFRGISATALTLTYPDLRTATRLTASLTERTYTCAIKSTCS